MAKKQKPKKLNKYVLFTILTAILSAPGVILIKTVTNTGLDDMSFMAIRYTLLFLVCLPSIIRAFPLIRKNAKLILISGVTMILSAFTFTSSISKSSALYASSLYILSPIIFLLMSSAFYKEGITLRKITGIVIAFSGAFIMFALPALVDSDIQFYPEATILIFIHMLVGALIGILWRKINEAHIPMAATLGITFAFPAVVALVISLIANQGISTPISIIANNLFILPIIVYASIVISIVTHHLNTISYRKVGASVISASSYLHKLLAVSLPIIFLNERPSVYLIIGAIVTVAGIIVIDTKHHTRDHHHRHTRH